MRIVKKIEDVTEKPLDDGQWYIYVIQNYPQGNIKIGRTKNPRKRFQTLSGSNSGGNKLVCFAISKPTWIYTIERIAHGHFGRERIDRTEWFDGNKVEFAEVVKYIDNLFNSDGYASTNQRMKENRKILGQPPTPKAKAMDGACDE